MKINIRIVGKVAVITATDNFHPLRNLSTLSEQLESSRFKGSVLFDLLSVNGLSENRFASMEFKDGSFDRKSFCIEQKGPLISSGRAGHLHKKHPLHA